MANRPITDFDAYLDQLNRFVWRSGFIMKPIFAAAKKAEKKRVIFAEGEDERVLRAAQVLLEEQIAKPILEFLPGWSEDITKIRDFAGLPANCQAYVKRLEELIRCRISGIGVGPGREEAVMINDLV